jgi:hypothetical protein
MAKGIGDPLHLKVIFGGANTYRGVDRQHQLNRNLLILLGKSVVWRCAHIGQSRQYHDRENAKPHEYPSVSDRHKNCDLRAFASAPV